MAKKKADKWPKDEVFKRGAIFDKACAVTLFDMHFVVTTDGRERGLWFWLDDQSDARRETYMKWLDGASKEWWVRQKKTPTPEEAFAFSMFLHNSVGHLLQAKIHEAAQLEWPAVKKLYEALGKALKARKVRER